MQSAAGSYFDGLSAVRHRVELRIENDTDLVIAGATLSEPLTWPLERLRATNKRKKTGELTLGLHTDGGDEKPLETARVTLSEKSMIARLEALSPNLYRSDVRRGTWPRIFKYTGIAVVSVVVMLFVILPRMADTLAGLIPIEKEIALGKSITSQIERALGGTDFGALHCADPKGQAALEKMVAQLEAGQTWQYDLEVTVFDHSMVNAFAAPGGQIVIMRGLLDSASSPEMVAAVLAHEIGHVENRDPTRHALRTVGTGTLLSIVLGDVTGGVVAVFLAERLLQASYTRDAEMRADDFALGALNDASIDSSGMAEFFAQMGAEAGEPSEVMSYFATHPASADRAERARENAKQHGGSSSVLTDAEWQALQDICD